MTDSMNKAERSAQMAKVRGTGNKSTEGKVETTLLEAGIADWEKHPKGLPTTPDFFFPEYKLAVFVDGCFWHACPSCNRRTPTNRQEFWRDKINNNRKRDNRLRRRLRRDGYHVIRIWEHELKKNAWLKRLQAMIRRIENQAKEYI